MTQSYDIEETHILVICDINEHISVAPPNLHGPFESVYEAQEYARAWREAHDIPGHENVEPTSEENEAWTEAGWYFGIFTPITLSPEQMVAEGAPKPGEFLVTVQDKGEDDTAAANEYLSKQPGLNNRPKTVTDLKTVLLLLLNAQEDNTDDDAMKQWYEAVDALDEESYFPVHLGPTPHGTTVLVKKGPDRG